MAAVHISADLCPRPAFHHRRLEDFLGAYARRPWDLGFVDCSMMLPAWLIWLGRTDPVMGLRGRYRSEREYLHLLKPQGGLVGVVSSLAAREGLGEAKTPLAGFLGVIEDGSGRWYRQWGAIFDGERWCVRLREGIIRAYARPLKIWTI